MRRNSLPLSVRLGMLRAAFGLAAALCLHAVCAEPAPFYTWKPGDILRFEYTRAVTTDQAVTGESPEHRLFTFYGVLILELKTRNKETGTVSAFLRFDTPRIDIPEVYWFQTFFDQPDIQKDKAKQMERALEGAIKSMHWNVTLHRDGTVTIDSRFPNSTEEWLREFARSGNWRPRYVKMWTDLLEKQFAFGVPGDDREIFVSFAEPPVNAAPLLDKIHTLRTQVALVGPNECKTEYSFKRSAPPNAGKAASIDSLGGPPVDMKLLPGVKTIKGIAVFDPKLNMLDWMDEEYAFEAEYTLKTDTALTYTLKQKVNVKYTLNRLTPKITECEKSAETVPVKAP